jgi:hypothetical protein
VAAATPIDDPTRELDHVFGQTASSCPPRYGGTAERFGIKLGSGEPLHYARNDTRDIIDGARRYSPVSPSIASRIMSA